MVQNEKKHKVSKPYNMFLKHISQSLDTFFYILYLSNGKQYLRTGKQYLRTGKQFGIYPFTIAYAFYVSLHNAG